MRSIPYARVFVEPDALSHFENFVAATIPD